MHQEYQPKSYATHETESPIPSPASVLFLDNIAQSEMHLMGAIPAKNFHLPPLHANLAIENNRHQNERPVFHKPHATRQVDHAQIR